MGHDCSIKPLHLAHVAGFVLLNNPLVDRGDTCLRGLVIMTKLGAPERIHRRCCRTCPLFDRGLGSRSRARARGWDRRFDDLHVEGVERRLRSSTKTPANEDDKEGRDGSTNKVRAKDASNLVWE